MSARSSRQQSNGARCPVKQGILFRRIVCRAVTDKMPKVFQDAIDHSVSRNVDSGGPNGMCHAGDRAHEKAQNMTRWYEEERRKERTDARSIHLGSRSLIVTLIRRLIKLAPPARRCGRVCTHHNPEKWRAQGMKVNV